MRTRIVGSNSALPCSDEARWERWVETAGGNKISHVYYFLSPGGTLFSIDAESAAAKSFKDRVFEDVCDSRKG